MKLAKFLFCFSLVLLNACSLYSKNKQESVVIKEEPKIEIPNNLEPEKDTFQKKPYKPIKGSLSKFELGRYQYCGDDRDCIVVNNGCCDCANGSPDVAINKSRLEAFKSRFDCANVYCAMKAQDPVCGSGVVSCINHKCQYFAPGEVDRKY